MRICPSCGRENEPGFRFCPACGVDIEAEPGSERRQLATLLFCDVSGSTAMGDRLDAESVRDIMFMYFHEMRSVIERHGGTGREVHRRRGHGSLRGPSGARGRPDEGRARRMGDAADNVGPQ